MGARRVLRAVAIAVALTGATTSSAAAAPRLHLVYLRWVRASWTIAVDDCPSCSQAQRSSGSFRTLAGRAALRRRAAGTVVELNGRRRRTRLTCSGPDLSAAPVPKAPRVLTLLVASRGRRVGFRWLLPSCDPEIDQPVADAISPATSRTRASLRRGTVYLRLTGRRRFDVAPDAPDAPPELGPAPGHWTGTLSWSLIAKLTRCRLHRGHRQCAF
jgi:hypothetical protein